MTPLPPSPQFRTGASQPSKYYSVPIISCKSSLRYTIRISHADFLLFFINIDICVGDPSAWNAGYGTCDTYADNKDNNGYCKIDCSGGQCAYQVCEECGECAISGIFNSTVHTKSEYIKLNIDITKIKLD